MSLQNSNNNINNNEDNNINSNRNNNENNSTNNNDNNISNTAVNNISIAETTDGHEGCGSCGSASHGHHVVSVSVYGIILSFSILLSGALSKYVVRTCLLEFSQLQILFYRFVVALIVISHNARHVLKNNGFFGISNLIKGNVSEFNYRGFGLQFVRAGMVCCVLGLTYKGYTMLPLSIAGMIGASEPIFVALWSLVPKYSRQAPLSLLLNVGISCFGIIMAKQNLSMAQTGISHTLIIGAMYSLAANMVCSLTPYVTMLMQKSGTHIEREMNVVYNIILSVFIIGAANLFIDPLGLTESFVMIVSNIKYIICFAVIGCIGVINSYILFTVFRYIHPTIYAIIQDLNIVLFMFIGVLSGEPIGPRSIAGAFLVLMSLVLLMHHRLVTRNAIKNRAQLSKQQHRMLSIISWSAVAVAAVIYALV
jgi:drug/metabolite transporter (DMT)-like permease